MEKRVRAQSEVIGVVLLIGVVTILVGISGTLLFSDAFGDEDRRDLVSVDSDLTAGTLSNVTVQVKHAGGKSYDASAIDVVLNGASSQRLALSAFDNTPGDRFSAGSEWTTTVSLSRGDVNLFVIHRPSGTVVHDDTYFLDPN